VIETKIRRASPQVLTPSSLHELALKTSVLILAVISFFPKDTRASTSSLVRFLTASTHMLWVLLEIDWASEATARMRASVFMDTVVVFSWWAGGPWAARCAFVAAAAR
jgi:hypothetical protein